MFWRRQEIGRTANFRMLVEVENSLISLLAVRVEALFFGWRPGGLEDCTYYSMDMGTRWIRGRGSEGPSSIHIETCKETTSDRYLDFDLDIY